MVVSDGGLTAAPLDAHRYFIVHVTRAGRFTGPTRFWLRRVGINRQTPSLALLSDQEWTNQDVVLLPDEGVEASSYLAFVACVSRIPQPARLILPCTPMRLVALNVHLCAVSYA